jgi:SAM-dependent methyltransferase
MAKIKKNFYSICSQLDLPFLETNHDFLKDIFESLEFKFGLKRNSNQRFIDLGCGDGRVNLYVALNYGIKSIGFEINPDLIQEAKKKIILLKNQKIYKRKLFRKIKIKFGDIFQQTLKKFDFIYIFSLPTMQKYLNHVFITAKKDAIIISYKYPLNNFDSYLKCEEKLDKKDENQEISIFFYRKI